MIVDDQEMIRMGLRAILETQDDIELVADLDDGFAALSTLDEEAIDVVLLDLRMPGIDGVEVTRRIRVRYSSAQVRILILTTFDNDENVLSALRSGANGFLSKGVRPTELASAIREVFGGGGALSGAAAQLLIAQLADSPSGATDPVLTARFDQLTAREREVVTAICRGASNDEAAATLFVSPFTVKTHASRAMRKVGARDRAQLVSMAFDSGLDEFRRSH
ncbi:response regulator transcription factor [Rathayibacter caricis]|nr:response regulator transcription factor [Rathayibacter caricis]